MAVVPSAGRTVPLYVLIVFVVLFLLATTGLVLLFVNQETLRQDAQQATTTFEDYVGTRNKSALEPYKAMGQSMKPKMTAVGALLQDRSTLAQMVAGNPAATSMEVQQKLQGLVETLAGPEAERLKETVKTDLFGAFRMAVDLVQARTQEVGNLQQQLAACQKSNNTITAGYQELESKFNVNTEKVMSQLSALQNLFDSYKADFSGQLEAVKSEVSKELQGRLTTMQKNFDLHVDELRDTVRRNIQVLIKSSAELGTAEMRERAGMTADQLVQKVDGQVLDITGPVVYIDMGKEQNIQSGMRFVVISATDKGQTQPKIKAVIEVISVGDLTSDAQVVAAASGDPILKGDLLLNLVYDRDVPSTFFVMGEFDLNNDGRMDPNGGEKVMEIIAKAGGKVSSQLSPAVNFVVGGLVPETPKKPAESGEEAQVEYEKQMKKIQAYNDLSNQVKALAIPVISAETFVKYTGYATDLK
jgi:hypothetical protein